jgi:putative transposase
MTARRESERREDTKVLERLKQLADENRSWGYRMLWASLRNENFAVNHKRVYRLYKEEKLQHRPRGKRRIQGDKKGHPPDPVGINEVWTLDFTSDALSNGRSFRTLNLLDAFNRHCHGIEVDSSLCSQRVTRALANAINQHGRPQRLQIDNGPEFRSHHLENWALKEGIELSFIEPGKPNQNSRIESFNSRFRQECLNQEWFESLDEARRVIETWRLKYNQQRPHSSLGYLPPDEWTRRYLNGRIQQKQHTLNEYQIQLN